MSSLGVLVFMSSEENLAPNHPARLILSPERIQAESIPAKELMEVEFEGGVFGPIWRVHLKAHIDAFKQLTQSLRVRDIDTQMEWVPLTLHPYFQKRTKEPMPSVPDSQVGNLFYLIQGGQKVGPFTKEQILEKINAYQLVMTDPISLDMGQSWIKVYQITEFDRRLKGESDPSHSNGDNVNSLYQGLRNNNVVGLQVLQSLTQPDPTNPHYDMDSTRIDPKKKSSGFSDIVELKYLALFIIGLVGIFSLLSSWNRPRSKRTPASIKQEKSRELEKKKRKDQANLRAESRKSNRANTNRTRSNRAPASVQPKSEDHGYKGRAKRAAALNNRKINRPRSRTDRSIRNSAAFRSTRRPASNSENANENTSQDDYYDDGETPDEQDPVRSQVSKETMDPAEEYDNEQQSEEEPYYSPTLKSKRRTRRRR